MSSIFYKNFHLCFSSRLIKSSPPSLTPPPSEQYHNHRPSPIFYNSFNHLYTDPAFTDTSDILSSSCSSATATTTSSSLDESTNSPPDIAAVFASNRFFFSSPGQSNSITESTDAKEPTQKLINDGGSVAVKKYSPDPYTDFRFSMEEMIKARELKDVKTEWEFLHELLFCYLNLNPKSTHAVIIAAFSDILTSMLSSSTSRSSSEEEEEDGCRKK